MPAIRTQIYLTREQRARLDSLRRSERKSLAELIREAIDAYLRAREETDLEEHFARTLGSIPDLEVPPRSEWNREHRWT
jgi:predicted DNA-binding protein